MSYGWGEGKESGERGVKPSADLGKQYKTAISTYIQAKRRVREEGVDSK